MIPITYFLSERLSELSPEDLEALAVKAGVTVKAAKRAAKHEMVSASDALALIAARGYDPMTRMAIPPRQVGPLKVECLALFLVAAMAKQNHHLRNAAGVMGVNTRVITDMRDAKPVAIENVLRLCAYIGMHPFEQCERVKEAA